LYLVSPLTLSEVRSMLPEGVTADLLNPSLQRFFQEQFHPGKTAILLRHGGCSCDLAGRRNPDTEEDERQLRARYRQEHADRSQVLEALDRHRARPRRPVRAPGHWSTALAGFVAEHARNAGPALYYLDFTPVLERMPPWSGAKEVHSQTVHAQPAAWLPDRVPMVVLP
jgi:hypothetical protein